ncbi:auxin response factor 17 [Impatiens glandulifera]|uniref:auxin response factor 17 n=1 Tax=Impatiens glandulifera TaxID=253017 RepID=UPI001FB19EC6|nr:auxin response factor 17 [Impatiens glandulifera]
MATPVKQFCEVDPIVWKGCAGSFVQIPSVGSRVYYFPQGHAEQSSSLPSLSPLVYSKPAILCRVAAVRFLANHDNDEVFASLWLAPINGSSNVQDGGGGGGGGGDGECESVADGDKMVESFTKVLTQSDANNGGGFSVPRYCADSIFPTLNYDDDPPVQTVSFTDVQGIVWKFRHIFRGTPRRHLLTTNWSKFVNCKNLTAGDSVVFMRKKNTDELYVGIRRSFRSNPHYGERWNNNYPVMGGGGDGSVKLNGDGCENGGHDVALKKKNSGFSRINMGMVLPESVAEAAELAAEGMPFEVMYYPRAGRSEFVVKAELVEESLRLYWAGGTRVKMAVETEDSSKMRWCQGTVLSVVYDDCPWSGSPWRILQVEWDKPDVLHKVNRVSPWQVEYVLPTPALHSTTLPPAKKCRFPLYCESQVVDGGGNVFFHMTGLSSSPMNSNNRSSWTADYSLPAGMQGARQDQLFLPTFPNIIDTTNHSMGSRMLYATQKLGTVSTELSIASTSESLSPESQNNMPFFRNGLIGEPVSHDSSEDAANSFLLFGKMIHVKTPTKNWFE